MPQIFFTRNCWLIRCNGGLDGFSHVSQDPTASALVHGLAGIRELMETSEPAISEATVDRIGARATGLLGLIDSLKGA